MADKRINVTFREHCPEEIELYNEICRNACGSKSDYIRRVFRELYNMDSYAYERKRGSKKKDEESTEEPTQEQSQESVEVEQPKEVADVKDEASKSTNKQSVQDLENWDGFEIKEKEIEPSKKEDAEQGFNQTINDIVKQLDNSINAGDLDKVNNENGNFVFNKIDPSRFMD